MNAVRKRKGNNAFSSKLTLDCFSPKLFQKTIQSSYLDMPVYYIGASQSPLHHSSFPRGLRRDLYRFVCGSVPLPHRSWNIYPTHSIRSTRHPRQLADSAGICSQCNEPADYLTFKKGGRFDQLNIFPPLINKTIERALNDIEIIEHEFFPLLIYPFSKDWLLLHSDWFPIVMIDRLKRTVLSLQLRCFKQSIANQKRLKQPIDFKLNN